MPAVFRVADNVAVPVREVQLAGSTALPSVLVKWTASLKAADVLPYASCAVTVKLNGVPDATRAGTAKTSRAGTPEETATDVEIPVSDAMSVSVAEMV